MNTATYNDDLDSSKVFPPPDVTGTFARFGDEVVCYVSDREWPLLVKSAEIAGVVLRKLDGDFESEQLYLAIQGGNSFVEEQPDVPVVLNKGRHLAVMLKPAQADRLRSEESPEYVVRPLKGREIVFDIYSPSGDEPIAEDWVNNLVASISPENVREVLKHLAGFLTRLSCTKHYLDAATWARHQLDLLGYETRVENVDLGGGKSTSNVVAEKRGTGAGNHQVTVVTAHLDSINVYSPDIFAPAPGADDNASGCAGLLEIARVLSKHAGRDDLRLILFGGEEQNTIGSKHHVRGLSNPERQRIAAVVNMDMIATVNCKVLTVLLEGAPVSQHVIDGLSAAAAVHTTLRVKCSTKPGKSDHVPFIRADIPAVLTIEGNDRANGNDHSQDDTLAHINYDLLLSILRMNLAFVAKSVGR